MVRRPAIVAHADWSARPEKRWICLARRAAATFVVEAPQPVGELSTLLTRLTQSATDGPVLVGFDFPIGLPLAYAKAAGITDFRRFLVTTGEGVWSGFYDLAAQASEIGVSRPFYPARAGGAARAHLTAALGLASADDLLRSCERKTPHRAAACSLFWTLGANQVGRAAISGWRDVLAPALKRATPRVGLWPFDGSLAALLSTHDVVAAETYPAEASVVLGLNANGRWSKRRQADRIERAPLLRTFARRLGVRLSAGLRDSIAEGFGAGADGEDRFDAAIGVLFMLAVVLGERPEGVPDTAEVREVEGWILGQS